MPQPLEAPPVSPGLTRPRAFPVPQISRQGGPDPHFQKQPIRANHEAWRKKATEKVAALKSGNQAKTRRANNTSSLGTRLKSAMDQEKKETDDRSDEAIANQFVKKTAGAVEERKVEQGKAATAIQARTRGRNTRNEQKTLKAKKNAKKNIKSLRDSITFNAARKRADEVNSDTLNKAAKEVAMGVKLASKAAAALKGGKKSKKRKKTKKNKKYYKKTRAKKIKKSKKI